MRKLKLLVELTYDEVLNGTSPEELGWFYANVLGNVENEGLFLHSNCIGDTVGEVKVLEILE